MSKYNKALGAGVAGAIVGPLAGNIIIPPGVEAPWWGYILAALAGAVITAVAVYATPKNAE